MVKEVGQKLIAQNKKARHDYSILDTYECGIVLMGTEVKSLRAGRASLIDGFVMVENGELWMHGVHIPEYTEGTWFHSNSILRMAEQRLRLQLRRERRLTISAILSLSSRQQERLSERFLIVSVARIAAEEMIGRKSLD